jgi:hypothetical protein
MKRICKLAVLIAIITMFTSITAYAGNKTPEITVIVNNKTVHYDVSPYLSKGEVMVPVRQTADALGGEVTWDKKNKTAWINLDMMHVEIIVGKSEIYIHRDADFSGIPQTVKLPSPVKKIRGRVFVPGITLFENMGMTVTWDSQNRVLTITSPLPSVVPYEEITSESISGNSTLMKWYNENNQKKGISSIRDGKYIYALIGAGEKPTGGYTINIDDIFYSSLDTITINARVTPPGDNVSVIMVITYPSTLIKIESDTIKTVVGDVVDSQTSGKEQWVTMDSTTVAKMELYDLDQVKLRDITGDEKDKIMQSFNEATIDQNPYIEMIAGNMLKVTLNDGYVITFTSYGSETNVIANFNKDGETRTFHLVAPVIAKMLLQK